MNTRAAHAYLFDDLPPDAIGAVIMLARATRLLDELIPVEQASDYLDDPALALEDFRKEDFPL